jgi:ribosome biogenesis GTPase
MSWRDLDEGDIRVRPNRKGSRPRTKERPAHADAVIGRVVAVDRGRYTCLVPAGSGARVQTSDVPPTTAPTETERLVTAMKARDIGRTRVVVGDEVGLVGNTSGGPDALARIVRIEERRSVLRRTADDTDPVERIIVANADQLAIVTALADPEPRPRMVDRCLVAAYDAGLEPVLVLTKADLVDPAEFLASYAPLEVDHVVTRRDSGDICGLEELHERLTGHVTVLVGHSGVGKSTLVNALVPSAQRAIGDVNDVTGRGRHTSTSAVALRLPNGEGWVIDTPGLRSFGLAHIDVDRIIDHFPDLAAGTDECPRGCTHDEEECALDEWVAQGHAGPAGAARLESLRRLLRSRSGAADY